MRLLNTKTLELEEFLVEDGLRYAILSHRWSKDEVLFADAPFLDKARSKQGFAKIEGFCELASAIGYKYAWVDTCCIDKSSSTELSEAINSMFRWYQKAAVCIVYLSDVDSARVDVEFVRSEWFRRGWTLQELLAPKWVYFFDKEWQKLGSKLELIDLVLEASGIKDRNAVDGQKALKSFTIAERMSWTARRVTTRSEDMAYCLLGIFDINMPLLYGEAERAFTRLQEQIMKESNDSSIFAWDDTEDGFSGLLARSPTWFTESGRHVVRRVKYMSKASSVYALTNYGLSISVRLWPWLRRFYIASVYEWPTYKLEDRYYEDRFCVLLVKSRSGDNSYTRVTFGASYLLPTGILTQRSTLSGHCIYDCRPSTVQMININNSASMYDSFLDLYAQGKPRLNWICLDLVTQYQDNLRISDVQTPVVTDGRPGMERTEEISVSKWDSKHCILKGQRNHLGTLGLFSFEEVKLPVSGRSCKLRKMLLGIDDQFDLVCTITSDSDQSQYYAVSGNDISTKRVEHITCLEKLGWRSEDRTRPGFWSFKLESWRREVKDVFLDGENAWMIHMELQEYPKYWAWKVTIGDCNDERVDGYLKEYVQQRAEERQRPPTASSYATDEEQMLAMGEYVMGNLDADTIPKLKDSTRRASNPNGQHDQYQGPEAPELMSRYFGAYNARKKKQQQKAKAKKKKAKGGRRQ